MHSLLIGSQKVSAHMHRNTVTHVWFVLTNIRRRKRAWVNLSPFEIVFGRPPTLGMGPKQTPPFHIYLWWCYVVLLSEPLHCSLSSFTDSEGSPSIPCWHTSDLWHRRKKIEEEVQPPLHSTATMTSPTSLMTKPPQRSSYRLWEQKLSVPILFFLLLLLWCWLFLLPIRGEKIYRISVYRGGVKPWWWHREISKLMVTVIN